MGLPDTETYIDKALPFIKDCRGPLNVDGKIVGPSRMYPDPQDEKGALKDRITWEKYVAAYGGASVLIFDPAHNDQDIYDYWDNHFKGLAVTLDGTGIKRFNRSHFFLDTYDYSWWHNDFDKKIPDRGR